MPPTTRTAQVPTAARRRAPRRRGLLILLAVTAAFAGPVGPATAATGAGSAASYRLTTVHNPVLARTEVLRWNPCDVIGYRVNAALGGRWAAADVHAAVARLSAASGLRFRYLGSTTHVPTPGRAPLAGTALVVSWARTGTTGHLATGQVAHGGWRATAAASGRYRITSGHVVVRAGAPLAAGFGSGVSRGRVLLHELGHAVGLDHVRDPVMAMHESVSARSPRAAYQAGDLAGLRRVGRPAGCLT